MSLIRRDVLHGVRVALLVGLVLVALATVALGVYAYVKWENARGKALGTPQPTGAASTTRTSTPTRTPRPQKPTAIPLTATGSSVPRPKQIGIVAGHWKHDSGAVCDDGLTEVQINLEVAQRVASLLQQSGFDVEILSEFAPELNGYRAVALVSIHADSCSVPEATGFKAARVSTSLVPELDDRLVACLIERYHLATGLPFHSNSITYDMTEYHAFYEIAPETPGAIIEIGFMAADRDLLVKKQDRVAQGIVGGIKCFVESQR